MYWAELYQNFRSELRAYTAIATITPRDFMRYASEGVNYMQECTDYIEETATLTIPANQGTLSTGVAYPITWRHIKSVFDDSIGLEYGVSEYFQYKRILETVNPVSNSQRQIPPMPQPYFSDSDYTAWMTFFVGTHVAFCYPTPSVDTNLTVHFIPTYPIFSAAEPSWASWFVPGQPQDDTNFNTQFTTSTPPSEFFNYARVITEFCKSKFLWGEGSRDAMQQATRCDAYVQETIEKMKAYRKSDSRRISTIYRMGL